MIKKYSLVFTALLCSFFYGFGQGSETFTYTNAPTGSYSNGSYTRDNALTWSYNGARKVESTYNISGTSIGFGTSGTRNVSAISDTNGVGDLTYSVRSYFTGGGASDRSIQVYINGSLYDNYTLAAMSTVYTRTIIANETGNVIIEFRSTGSRQIILDDVSWSLANVSETLNLNSIICNNNSTPNDDTDDFITFEINPTGGCYPISGNYNVIVNSGNVSPISAPYGSATTFTLQNGSAGAGDVNLTITDNTNGTCSLNQLITDPGSCSVPPSSCTPIITDDFSGSLVSWSNTADWTVTGGELKHDLSGTAGLSDIYADIGAQNLNAGNYEWQFCMRNGNWDPSTNNDFTFYLLSDNIDLIGIATGYAVGVNRIGSSDLLTLYEVNNNSHSAIITSAFNWGNNDDVCVRVTRNSSGFWELLYNPNSSGEVSAGTVTNNTHSTGNYIGAYFDFSSSYAGQLWIDDVSVCSNAAVSGPELQLVAGGNDVSCGYTLNFGNVESDGSILDLSVFVDNDGSSALDINSLTIAGGNAGDFSIVNPISGFPISVAPGLTQEIKIKFTSNTNGLRTSTLTINNTDGSDGNDETICAVILNGTGVTDSGGGALMITQYYEGSGVNKWIEIANVSGNTISAGSYYLAVYNKGGAPNYTERPLNGRPNASVSIPALAIGEIIRFKEPLTVEPAYAVPGETGYDNGATYDMMVGSFSGDDIIIISPTNDASSYELRMDIIGEYGVDGYNWGNRRCFIRNECVASNPSITFDINEWIEFTDAEVETPLQGTNPYLGQHFRGVTKYTTLGWDNGLPERSRIVEVGANYNTLIEGSFEACSLEVNSASTLDINAGDYVSIINDLTTKPGATLNVQHEGSLVMVDDTGVVTNNGATNIYKTTSAMEEFDYQYWSSPVFYGSMTPFPTPIAFVLTDFDSSRMYEFKTINFNDANDDNFDDNGDDWVSFDSDMKKGIGYAAMAASSGVRSAVFSGEVNNGIVSVNVGLSADANGDIDDDEDDWNLVGNPYPSAILADDFIAHNSNLNGTIYFWTHINDISLSNPGPDAYNFSTDDYAMYNATGGIGTGSASGSNVPTGFIASGQGFFVDAISAGTIEFNNSMRSLSYSNNDFFRTNDTTNEVKKDRVWLNLTNSDGAFSQILLGFFDDATFEKDRLYDGTRLKGTNYLEFYSMDNTTLEYGIQGRPSFNILDKVLLGLESNIVGSLSIELGTREGELLNNPIYLIDKYILKSHDLTISPYVFSTETGKFNDRFEIVFTRETLSIDKVSIDDNALQIIELQNGEVQFKVSSQYEMKSVEIIDLLGRTIYRLNAEGNSQTFSLSNLSQAPYLAKVKFTNGQIITKKALKRK